MFQLGMMAPDVRDHRDGAAPTADLTALIALVSACRGDMPYFVFRGLAALPADVASPHEERSLSSWTLYPSIAMRTALAHGSGPIVLLRDRLANEDPALYLDDFEHEVLRPPLRLTLGWCVTDKVTFLGARLEVAMIDCVDAGADDG